jgi:drug/metabolite transporter (DMT)-like permease
LQLFASISGIIDIVYEMGVGFLTVFFISFLTVFLAELGDKTQLVTLTLSSRYSPRQVLTGALAALAAITGLAVVLVPFMGAIFFKRRPSFYVYIAALIAAVGLALLSLDLSAGIRFDRGDLYLLLCAISFAMYILFLGKYAPANRVMMLTTVQVVFTCTVGWVATLILEEPVSFSGPVWTGLIYLAVVATIFTTAGQTWGQKKISPERAALIFTLEPVFALFFAMVLLGERLPPAGILGSVLIMVGIIGAELAPRKGKQAGVE